MLRRSARKPLLVVGLLLFVVLLSGCTTDAMPTIPTDELTQGGFWQKYIVYPFALALDFFAGMLFNQYGLSILVVTIIIRFLILPLTLKQYRSSKAMQALQPEMMKLRDKYKNDQQKYQEEMMKLYQQNNVNPMAGCLPILIQMPILLALYNAIMFNPAIRGEHSTFLWMDLSEPDKLFILPTLAAITTYLQQKMVSSQQPNNPMQALLIIFPILIFVMSMSFPAALPLYWVYSNLFTLVQTYFIYGIGKKNKEGQVKGGKS